MKHTDIVGINGMEKKTN